LLRNDSPGVSLLLLEVEENSSFFTRGGLRNLLSEKIYRLDKVISLNNE
jgi:hypothetical protein